LTKFTAIRRASSFVRRLARRGVAQGRAVANHVVEQLKTRGDPLKLA
jgi:hypothetical protein